VSLFLDDIEEVTDILNGIGAGGKVTVSDGEYDFESLDEFIRKRGKSPRVLVLREHLGPTFKVHRLDGPSLRDFDSSEYDSVYLKLQAVLDRRRRLLTRIFVPVVWWVIYGFACLSTIGFGMLVVGMKGPFLDFALHHFWIWMGPLVVSTLMASPSGIVYRLSQVNLAHAHETTTFWSRHAEIFNLAIAAILGGLATAVFERLFRK
jgi:hypothetical protein